jgi:hypothetical protein
MFPPHHRHIATHERREIEAGAVQAAEEGAGEPHVSLLAVSSRLVDLRDGPGRGYVPLSTLMGLGKPSRS